MFYFYYSCAPYCLFTVSSPFKFGFKPPAVMSRALIEDPLRITRSQGAVYAGYENVMSSAPPHMVTFCIELFLLVVTVFCSLC